MCERIEAEGRVLGCRVRWARSWRERAQGLSDLPPLRGGEALVLEPARQIHTFGLGYPLDVVFCDEHWRVRHVVRGLRPNRVTRPVLRARRAIELPAGALPPSVERGSEVRCYGSSDR